MKYLMFVATDAEPDAIPEAPGDIEAWFEDVNGRGKWLDGDRLQPHSEAKTVRTRSGKVLVTDGPFTESKEVIVEFDILDCDSLEEAIDIAAKHPMARAGRIEVRAVWPHEGS
jgi:hypothetical protein